VLYKTRKVNYNPNLKLAQRIPRLTTENRRLHISSGRTKAENCKRLPSPAGEDGCMAIYVLDTLQDERITELDSDRYPHFIS